ncbi:hypothetical protein RHGRI_030032 [Rhododendron griersonianum]|uniref:Serine hydrolase domain-containing protein n=1 Tax=Rhododendron griersonianum TaxID=479676 RepID=A0AAV6ILB1_9ERIC|nr:hypothetical protein RHGRI_030032 [Rhododendron griersonianum]
MANTISSFKALAVIFVLAVFSAVAASARDSEMVLAPAHRKHQIMVRFWELVDLVHPLIWVYLLLLKSEEFGVEFRSSQSEVYNFEECLHYIEDFMIKHGPFDGLMGFSQGGILSAALPGMQSDGVALTKVPKIKYLIIMSGGKLGGTGSKFSTPKLAANAFSTPVQCPSLHIIGTSVFRC